MCFMRTVLKEEAESVQVVFLYAYLTKPFINGNKNQVDI